MITVGHLHDLLERHGPGAELAVLLEEQEGLVIILGHLDHHPDLFLCPLLVKKLDNKLSLGKSCDPSFCQVSSDLPL